MRRIWPAKQARRQRRGGRKMENGSRCKALRRARTSREGCQQLLLPLWRIRMGHGYAWKQQEGRRRWTGRQAACRDHCSSPPLSVFLKLLQNLHNNFKISKNEICSNSQDLQLCFLNHPLILRRFLNLKLGTKRGI
jgi:hypothetical protein